jgi:hypothetical protein
MCRGDMVATLPQFKPQEVAEPLFKLLILLVGAQGLEP